MPENKQNEDSARTSPLNAGVRTWPQEHATQLSAQGQPPVTAEQAEYDWAAHCTAVVPCFNEEKTVGSVVGGLREHLRHVVVVDDGSTDETGNCARGAGAVTLRNQRQLGKGGALRVGFDWALNQGFEWAATLDGDGQHAPEDLPALLACAQSTSAKLIVGNRMKDATAMPWLRRSVNRWMSRRLSRMVGRPLPDSQCGFRLVNLLTWSERRTCSDHFEFESELLVCFGLAGFKIEFVPIKALYKDEQSKIHPLRDSVRWFRWWRKTLKNCANRARD